MNITKKTYTVPREIYLDILASENSKKLILSASIDLEKNILHLLTGDFEDIHIDLSFFEPTPTFSPDFEKLQILDYGQTIAFGRYETPVEKILKEFYEPYIPGDET